MRTEVQNQLITAYEELAIKRATCGIVMAAVASVCAEYGIDDNVLNAVNERARRAVIQQLRTVDGPLAVQAQQAIVPIVEKQDEPNSRAAGTTGGYARSVSRKRGPVS